MKFYNLFIPIVILLFIKCTSSNSEQQGINTLVMMPSLEERKKFIENTFKDNPKVKVVSYQGLTTEFCKEIGVNFILRGLRNPADFEFEKAIAHTNRELSKVETVFLLTSTQTSFISSSIVREIIRFKGDYKKLVPNSVRTKKS